jgi:hypothetical protein
MKNPSFSKKSCALALAMSAIVAPVIGQDYLNFTNSTIDAVDESIINYQDFDYHAGIVGDAVFRRAESFDPTKSGAGSFRALYLLKADGTEQGYNRPDVNDATTIGKGTGELLTSELLTDNTGKFYIFAIDVNENGSKDYISLDAFQVWAGAVTPDPFPEVTSDPDIDLVTLGKQIYNMDNLNDTTIFLDSSLSTGSGRMDMFVFVSMDLFDDAKVGADDQIYVYTAFGGYGGSTSMASSGGDEEVAIISGSDGKPITVGIFAPEPSSAILVAIGGVMFALRRRRCLVKND